MRSTENLPHVSKPVNYRLGQSQIIPERQKQHKQKRNREVKVDDAVQMDTSKISSIKLQSKRSETTLGYSQSFLCLTETGGDYP